jgi:hypothetical protein
MAMKYLYKHIHSLQGCRHWVENVIYAEYDGADEVFKEGYKQRIAENKAIFQRVILGDKRCLSPSK